MIAHNTPSPPVWGIILSLLLVVFIVFRLHTNAGHSSCPPFPLLQEKTAITINSQSPPKPHPQVIMLSYISPLSNHRSNQAHTRAGLSLPRNNAVFSVSISQVLMFEMLQNRTPFAPPVGIQSQSDQTIFDNVARAVNLGGVAHVFPDSFDDTAGGGRKCRDLISSLMEVDTEHRLGNGVSG